ncbi:hypothetical protein UCRNP2_3465 [Neofusicoccum parvum UCRNP2]|uniref:Uncharacterized protein n=1 Tax=Botryosphaeria parva (strain UCR-NP2) TaxID=1287680 RepID=R1GUK0_BOTPV|nr:hypothetical protein UCRNP2_3465 [Neofusicoccum parvum UCRNP2]
MGNAPSTQATTPAPDAVNLDNRKRARPNVDSTDDDEPLSKQPNPAGSKQPHTSFMAGDTTDHQSAKASNNKKVRPVKKATGTRKKKAAITESENTTAPDLSSVRSALLNETEGVEAIYSAKEVAAGNDTTGSEVAASQPEATPKSSSTGEVVDTSTRNPLEEEYKAHKAPGEACKTLEEYKAFLISTGFLRTEEDPKNSESLETCEAPETSERPKTKYAIAKERKQAREAAAAKAKADAEIAAAEAAALAEDITYSEYEIPDLEDDILGEDPVTAHVSPKLTIYLRHYSGAPGAEHGIVPFSLKRLLLGSHRIHDLVAHVGAAALEDTEIPLPRFITRATVTDYAIYTADRTNNISHADAHWTPRRALRLAALALHMADPDCADACASTLARLLRDPDPAAPPLFDAADASAFCAQADALAACLVDAPRNAVARRLARLAPMRRLVVDVLAASPARAREVLDGLDEGFYRGFVDAVRERCAEREEEEERKRRAEEERRAEEKRHAGDVGLDDDDVYEAPRVGKKRKTSDEEMLADTRARASMLGGYWGGRGSDDSEDSSDDESDDEGWPKPSVVPHWLYPIRAVEFEERRKKEEERRKREEEGRGAAEGRS